MAIAADPAARYGSATAPLTVARLVMTRPAVPRVLTRLDRASIRATVAASGVAGAGSVRIESLTPSLLAVSGGPQAVTVADGGRAVAAFDVEARGEGVARIRVTATVGGDSDVVERTIAIVDRSVPEVSAAVGAAAPEAIETIRLPAGIDHAGGALELELASTKLVGLGAAADYVVRYAYLCAEQAASRALALILRGALESPDHDGARRRPRRRTRAAGAPTARVRTAAAAATPIGRAAATATSRRSSRPTCCSCGRPPPGTVSDRSGQPGARREGPRGAAGAPARGAGPPSTITRGAPSR